MLSQNNQTHSNALFVFLCDFFWTQFPHLWRTWCHVMLLQDTVVRCDVLGLSVGSWFLVTSHDVAIWMGFLGFECWLEWFWLFCKHVSTCPSQILHRRPQDSLPLLFLDLWFWDFLQETLRKGRQCFDAWAAFENKGIGFERGTHEETQLLQYTTVPPGQIE
jgi:hypothetical protein